MMSKRIWHSLMYVAAVGAGILALFFVVACVWIGNDVKQQCQTAQRAYGGDCVEALVQVLVSEQRSFRERNSAIWALGQLGDARALPVLQGLYTGVIPAREPLNAVLSQYELKKAVALAAGGVNISAPFWRYGIERMVPPPLTIAQELERCLPMSNMKAKERCDQILSTITDFERCAAAGLPVAESYPEQCRTPDGRLFVKGE